MDTGGEKTRRRRKPAGTGVRAGGKNGPQLIKTGGAYWTDEAEAVFLDVLGASCNVKRAAEACGYSHTTLYRRRRLDPVFAERWRAAMEQGYVRIEAALIEAAENALTGTMPDPDRPFPEMTVREAIDLLRVQQQFVKGNGQRTGGRPPRRRTLEEVHASILSKITAIETARADGRA